MVKTVTVPALATVRYQGRTYRRGEEIVMSPLEAAIHARRGLVSLSSTTYRTQQLVGDPPEPTARRRRRYLRRDLTAEASE